MDKEGLDALLSEHYEYVRKKAWMLINTDEAEDLANDAMVKALRGLDGLKDPGSMKAWLKTIVENEAKVYYARRLKRREINRLVRIEAAKGDLADISAIAAGELSFQRMMQRAEAKDMVDDIMDSLDPVRRSILGMKFWGGYNFTEIGEILGINASTVRSTYTRCRQRLYDKYGNIGKEADPDDR